MNELKIALTGKITTTNFDEWKTDLLAQIASAKRDLKSDDDFANAENAVKTIKAGELALKNAKISALEQAAEIQKLFAGIDEVTEDARQARLSLERQIKARKIEIRDEIIDAGMADIDTFLAEQPEIFQTHNEHQFANTDTLESMAKGKRTTKSLQTAITKAVMSVKKAITDKVGAFNDNENTLAKIDTSLQSLFQDRSTLLNMPADDLVATIEKRIAFFEEEQARVASVAPEIPVQEAEISQSDTLEAEPNKQKDATPETNSDVANSFTVSIELFADKSRAAEFIDELEGRYSHREFIGEIRLFPS